MLFFKAFSWPYTYLPCCPSGFCVMSYKKRSIFQSNMFTAVGATFEQQASYSVTYCQRKWLHVYSCFTKGQSVLCPPISNTREGHILCHKIVIWKMNHYQFKVYLIFVNHVCGISCWTIRKLVHYILNA